MLDKFVLFCLKETNLKNPRLGPRAVWRTERAQGTLGDEGDPKDIFFITEAYAITFISNLCRFGEVNFLFMTDIHACQNSYLDVYIKVIPCTASALVRHN